MSSRAASAPNKKPGELTQTLRLGRIGIMAAFLAGCASVHDRSERPVNVQAAELSRESLSFNAQVLKDAAELESSFAATAETGVEPVTRLQSAYTHQLGAEQLRLGDAVSSVGMWGTALRFGGMQFGTPITQRADVISESSLASSGVAVLPTVADALFASLGDPGSSFSRRNLSSVRNRWDPLRLTVKDAAGRTAAVNAPIIADTRLIRGGCSDFSLGVGRARRDYAIKSNDYGPLFANTTVSCGAPLGFTVEGHGEYLEDEVAAVGLGLARRVGPLGTASVAFASSRAEYGTGWLARFGFEHRSSLFDLTLRSRLQSRAFRDAGSFTIADPVTERSLASVGLRISDDARLSLAYATQMTWAGSRSALLALKQSVNLGRGSLAMSAGHSFADDFDSSLLVSYSRPLGLIPRKRDIVEEFDIDALLLPARE